MNTNPQCALIIGAGEGTGEALARRCAAEGLIVCLMRRNQARLDDLVQSLSDSGVKAHGYCLDATDEDALVEAIEQIESDVGPLMLAVYNVSGFIKGQVVDLTARQYREGLSVALGGFVAGRELAKMMLPRGLGTIIFTSSTASLRGSAGFAALAGGRHALRALSQSMARELGPQGIHVAHLVMDGGIDTPALRQACPDLDIVPDSLMSTEAVADACWSLHTQPRCSWTQEQIVRPWTEKW